MSDQKFSKRRGDFVEESCVVLDEKYENDNDDVEVSERSEDISSKLSSQEVFRAIETLEDYSLFRYSGKIGNLAAEMSSMVSNENLKSKKRKNS